MKPKVKANKLHKKIKSFNIAPDEQVRYTMKVKAEQLDVPRHDSVHHVTAPPPPRHDPANGAMPSGGKRKKAKLQREAKLKRAAAAVAAMPEESAAQPPPSAEVAPMSGKAALLKRKLAKALGKKMKRNSKPSDSSPAPNVDDNGTASQQQQQQAQKRKQSPVKMTDKRPKVIDVEDPAPSSGATGGGAVRDPVLRAEIVECLRQRAACTVRVARLPNRLRPMQIQALCQGIVATRIPWNYATGRSKGVAFLEFASPDSARRGLAELRGSKALGTRPVASIRAGTEPGVLDTETGGNTDADVDAYNCCRVAVCALHPLTTGQELKDLVLKELKGAVQRVDFLHGSKALRKHAPAVAFLTFADERRALEAVKKFQGHVIRGRCTSWLFQKRADRVEHERDRTELVAFGVSKRVTDADLVKAFPRSLKLDVRQGNGMAIVTYSSEADCTADYAACKGGLIRVGNAKLRVQYGHVNYKPIEERREASQKSLKRQQMQQKPRRPPQPPPKPVNIDPSLFNKSQLILKNFKPSTQESDISGFLSGVRRVFFTPNRRLAFAHFGSEAAAAEALAKLAKETLNGAKLKAMYAMDKPDKKKTATMPQQQQEQPPSAEPMHVDNNLNNNAARKIKKPKKFNATTEQRMQ